MSDTIENNILYKGRPVEELERPELIEAIYWLYNRMQEDAKIKKQYTDLLRLKP